MAVETSAIITVASAFGTGGLLGVVLKFALERTAGRFDERVSRQKRETEDLAKRTTDLFEANEALRRDLNSQIDRLGTECVSLRTQLDDERRRSDLQDKALAECERRSADCDRRVIGYEKLLANQSRELRSLQERHDDLNDRFTESEKSREALRVLVAGIQARQKSSEGNP